ncbi:MAG: sugar ABC transporter ATP-binding protein [Actinobacteria bacterium]|nr:sugar ABC transporter ATP-binding protein [Actinomycetota bacterium]
MPDNEILMEMSGITKNFPGVLALDDVSVSLYKGEILGLLGENGAGKSTLIKILSGAYMLEKGKIIIKGKECKFLSPHESLAAGIRVIYQELTSFEPLTVLENIFAGEVVTNKAGFVSWKEMAAKSKKILSMLGSEINPSELMENLSVGQKQIVEIAKAIHGNAKIIVMDEPTSALDEKEVNTLYSVIRKLREQGVGVIYISHRMEEIFQITDRVAVLRDGKKVGDIKTHETNKFELVNLIVGRELSEQYPKRDIKKGKVIFEVKDLTYLNKVKNVSFNLREGEIVAFFGLLGAGTHQLFSVIFGDKKATSGEIYVDGRMINVTNPNIAKKSGLGYIPIDRKEEGLALVMDLKQNITSANIEEMGAGFILNKRTENEHATKWFNTLNIKAPSIDTLAGSLSGGNQQKVVVAKWLEKNSRILLMNEPTRGIDVGSKSEIYMIAEDLCEKGVGVLMVSSELPEILAISDRVIVMRDGEIVGEFVTKDTDQEELMHLASA